MTLLGSSESEADSVGSIETTNVDRSSVAGGCADEQSDEVVDLSVRKIPEQETSSRTARPDDDDDEDGDASSDDFEDDDASDGDYVERRGESEKASRDLRERISPRADGARDTINLKEAELFIKNYTRVAFDSACYTGRTIRACIIPANRPNMYSFKAFSTNGATETIKFKPNLPHKRFRALLIEVRKAKKVSLAEAWNDVLKNGDVDIHIEVLRVKADEQGGFTELEFKMMGPEQAREIPARMPTSATRGPGDAGQATPADETAIAQVQLLLTNYTKEACRCLEELRKENTELRAKCKELMGKRKADETIEWVKERRDAYKKRLHESEAARIADKAMFKEQADKLDAYYDKYGPLG